MPPTDLMLTLLHWQRRVIIPPVVVSYKGSYAVLGSSEDCQTGTIPQSVVTPDQRQICSHSYLGNQMRLVSDLE